LRRVKGADVILVGGVPALYLERHRAVTFPALELHGPAVVEALKAHFAAARPTVRIDVVDGTPARQAGLGQLLERSGFVATPRGLLLSRA
jgi:ATP-dependent Lhr-like helicase